MFTDRRISVSSEDGCMGCLRWKMGSSTFHHCGWAKNSMDDPGVLGSQNCPLTVAGEAP